MGFVEKNFNNLNMYSYINESIGRTERELSLRIRFCVAGKLLTDNVTRHCDKTRELQTGQNPLIEYK